MSDILELYHRVDFLSVAFVSIAAYVVGNMTAGTDVTIREYCRRAGIAIFVLYAILAFVTFTPTQYDHVISILLRGVVLAGIAYGAVGLCLPVLSLIWRIVSRPWIAFCRWRGDRMQRREARRREKEAARQREVSDREWERTRPERERAAREAESRKKAEDQIKADAHKRREDARAACELLYSRHAPEIGTRFTRAMLDDFFTRYMGDDRSPDTVEERGRQLLELINQHCEATQPKQKVHTIDELARWYLTQKERIDALALDEEMKLDHLTHLEIRYSELSQEILEKVRP